MAEVDYARYLRQQDLLPVDSLPKDVVVIGVGGLGSHTSERLAKMGCPNLVLYDPDVVEAHNLGSQAFLNDAVGKPKVEAMKELLSLVAECNVETKQVKFDGNINPGSVVLCLPDSMETRLQVWNDYVKLNPMVPLYIEARMAGLFGFIYCFNPCDPKAIEAYEKTLFSDDTAEELPCTARGVDFNCCGLSSTIAAAVAAFALKNPFPFEMVIDYSNFSLNSRFLDEKE